MTVDPSARDALAKVPGWDPGDADVTELDGGLVNRSFFVRYRGDEFVLRLGPDASSGPVGVEQSCERRVHDAAAAKGLAPAVVFADEDAGVLLTRFLAGRTWRAGDLEEPKNLEALAELLREVHSLPRCGQSLDIAAAGSRYAGIIAGHGGDEPFSLRCLQVIRATGQGDALTCCHNDVVAANVVESERLRLIDWEFAGDNDPFFDLASLVGFHDVDERRADILLGAYTGGSQPASRERLGDLVRAYDALQWLWFAARQGARAGAWEAGRLGELRERIRDAAVS
jgi:thiamine kinase-like enzyme